MTSGIESAANTLFAAVHAQFRADALAKENGAEIMRLARLMCRAGGWPPDVLCMGNPDVPVISGPKGTCGIYLPMQPHWALYWDQAEAALAAEKGASDAPKTP